MQLIFSNPAGAWALLGVPALVLIHFLQRHSRRVKVSTLFLLDKQDVESRSGRRLERWRNSSLFWLQILAVLLLAWTISEPRWMKSETIQHLGLVMDSSLSMGAFRGELERGLSRDTATLARGASRTEWLLLESDSSRPPLYRGEDRAALLQSLKKWQPDLESHSPIAALRAARAAVGDDGLLFFVTDTKPAAALPVEARPLAYGRPLDNVGVASALAEKHDGQPLWRVLVRNYSDKPQQRSWWIETAGQRTPSQALSLQPGELSAVQGSFPPGTDRITFALEPDGFTTDDRAPIVLPKPKPLTLALLGPREFTRTLEPVTDIIEAGTFAANPAQADVAFMNGPELGAPPAPQFLFFKQVTDGNATIVRSHPATEPQPIMSGLNFSGLLYQAPTPIAVRGTDVPLLWDDTTPLIFLRTEPNGRRTLVFNVDPGHSNLTRLPAFVLLVNRFLEEARRRKPGVEHTNFLAQQPLHLVLPGEAHNLQMDVQTSTGNTTVALSPALAAHTRAPGPPAFFTVKVDGQVWLDGTAQFPDPRESDFRDAKSVPLDLVAQVAREQTHSRADSLTPLWLLAMLGALLASWREAGKS